MATRVGDISAPAARPAPSYPRVKALFSEPFRIAGTELPGNVLLLAKIVTLAFIATGQFRLFSRHFLPFLPIFDRLGSPAAFHWSLVTIFLAAAAALFYNAHVRTCCLVLGGVILISLLSSRAYFENNRTYCACILILAGLCRRGQTPWPIRSQVVLVYFGAALNKLLQQDWRSGQFFAYWFGQIHHPHLWARITSLIPAMPLAQFLCWTTIITEFVLVAGFLVPRWYAWSIWLGAAYHTSLLLVMNSTFGMFYYAMLASYLAFVEWPQPPLEILYDDHPAMDDAVRRFFLRLDITSLFNWRPSPRASPLLSGSQLHKTPLLLEGSRVHRGWGAFKRMLLLNPFAYFCYVILLGRQPHFFQYHRWLAAAVLAVFTPFLDPVGDAAYRWAARRRLRRWKRKSSA